MNHQLRRAVLDHLSIHGGATNADAVLALGATPHQLHQLVVDGTLTRLHGGVFIAGGHLRDARAALTAACLAAGQGAAASHQSAVWAWHLREAPPPRPTVTVPYRRHPSLAGVEVHRSRNLPGHQIVVRKHIPVTSIERTLIDIGTVVPARQLDDLVDLAVARRLVEPSRLHRAMLQTPFLTGSSALRGSLLRRGYLDAPDASVLESRLHRLYYEWGIRPLAVEKKVLRGRYRVDTQLTADVMLEVDGYTFHATPSALASDIRRHNILLAAGIKVIRSDWVTVMHDPDALLRHIQEIVPELHAGECRDRGRGRGRG